MNTTYTCKKRVTTVKPHEMEILFSNGDYLTVAGEEIKDIYLDYYDNLVWFRDCAARVCHEGFVKFKLEKIWKNRFRLLHDEKEFSIKGNEYLTSRFENCIIDHIVIYDGNNCSHAVFGDAVCSVEDGIVTLKYRPNERYGDFGGDSFKIELRGTKKSNIVKINLDFENCDGIDVFAEEIVGINPVFSNKLIWEGGGYVREIIGGLIGLRFDKKITWRKVTIYPDWEHRAGVKPLVRRICGRLESEVDICHLYISYEGSPERISERICIRGINDEVEDKDYDFEDSKPDDDDWDYYDDYDEDYDLDEEYDDDEDYDDDDDDCDYLDYDDEEPFVSGYAKKCKAGEVLVVFGKARATEK